MNTDLQLDAFGHIRRAVLGGVRIPFRGEQWSGPAWRVRYGGKMHAEDQSALFQDNRYVHHFWGVTLIKRVFCKQEKLFVEAILENHSSQFFRPDSLGLWLGIDTYMDSYPEWNSKYIPTLLCCEKTHFYGYFASPGGNILGVACKQAAASWTMDYNSLFCEGGHRINGVTFELLSKGVLGHEALAPGETRAYTFVFYTADSVSDTLRLAADIARAPICASERLIFEPGEVAAINFYLPQNAPRPHSNNAEIMDVTNGAVTLLAAPKSDAPPLEITLTMGDKQAHCCVYWRAPWSWYMKNAADEALRMPQKATSNAESWYGLFSCLISMKTLPDGERYADVPNKMQAMIPKMFDTAAGVPTLIPKRIQNTSTLISLSVDAYEATGGMQWLTLAQKLADFLIDRCQHPDGSFRNSDGIHYTCVIYIAKSIIELWLLEKALGVSSELRRRHFDAAKRATDELVRSLDNIGTEGEHTFEDGMISCSVAQIALMALFLRGKERSEYIAAAKLLLEKHRCLERMGSADARSRNTTIRFWEAQYDILCPCSMQTSPHGWSAWKAYGVWYLYLLTGEVRHLIDAMETLGSCATLMDERGRLRWAYVVDPKINGALWVRDEGGNGRLVPATFGQCALEMISAWYRRADDRPSFGYLGEYEGYQTDQGGCCDNDVHEIFKAIGEIALNYAYVYEKNGTLGAYNASVKEDNGVLYVSPNEKLVSAVHLRLNSPRMVRIAFTGKTIERKLLFGWINANGRTADGYPEF